MSPSWIWGDKITNKRVARVGYKISTILQSVRNENLAHYFPYDVKLGLLAHSLSFLANQKARNAIYSRSLEFTKLNYSCCTLIAILLQVCINVYKGIFV